jgi:RepB DNA-primase N-terminal domain
MRNQQGHFTRYAEHEKCAEFTAWLAENGHEPNPLRAEAKNFLKRLDPSATYFTFQTFDDNKERLAANKLKRAEANKRRKAKGLKPLTSSPDPFARILHGTLDKRWKELVDLNKQGAGVFITVNETDGKGRETENIKRVRALFLDLDGAPLDPVMESEPEPHIVVESSPGRFHPYLLVTGVKLEQFRALQKALIERFGGDKAIHDLPRVMRLPGFVHRKARRS